MKLPSIAVVSILVTMPVASPAESTCSARSGSARVPLVELYTSEGCSSCPPADRWMSSMVERSDISLLAFHVDYWDYIGWKDRFALGGNAERQRKRVSTAGGDTVYTPQVMVGEQTHVEWNSPTKFEAALIHGESAAGVDIELHVMEKAGMREFSVSTGEAISSVANIRVWLAYTLDGQNTTVRAGENRGATLQHDGVVRHLWGPWTPPVSESMQIVNPDAEETSWNLVAFAQDADGRTLQSLTLKAGNCPVPMP